MKKPISLALCLLMIAMPFTDAGAADTQRHEQTHRTAPKYQPKSPKISRGKLDALLAKPENLLLIDLRRPDEISRIGGFPVYLNIQAAELEKSLAYIPKDRIIVTVSNHAKRSGQSADYLAGKGYNVAGYVGVKYYEEEGGKLVKIRPPKKTAKNKS